MCTQHLHHVYSPTHFPYILLTPTATNSPSQEKFHPLVLQFCKWKIWHFCLFKIATWKVSLWHFHIYICKPELVHLLYFSSFCLSFLFIVASIGLKILYSFLNAEYINRIHFPNFLLLPSFS
jgi:hypothetical protein